MASRRCPTHMNTNEHQPTPEEVEVYSAAIMEGLQARVILVADEASTAAKIGTIRPLGEDGKIPREVIFDMQKRGDFEQMEVAALKSQTPKQHPVKVGEWVKASNGAVSQVLEVHKDWYLIARGHGWTFANCEPYDPPATHDTAQGKAAAESAAQHSAGIAVNATDTVNPLRSMVRPFRVKYIIRREDFCKNLGDILTAVPRVLVRQTMLLMKDIFARLLRSGDILPRGYAGLPFFAVDKFGATGNLHHNTPLTRAAVDAGIDEMATRGIVADTLIVPPALYGAAVQSVKMNNHVFSGEDGVVVTRSEPSRIKQIIRLPELDNGAAVMTSTWYLASCLGPNGPRALYGAVEEGFEFLTNLGNPYSISDSFIWMAERHAAFEYGDAAYINRYEQGEPSAPHPNDIAWLDKITTYPGPMFEDEVVFDKPDETAAAVSPSENLVELIAKVAAMTGLDADTIAARIEKARAK